MIGMTLKSYFIYTYNTIVIHFFVCLFVCSWDKGVVPTSSDDVYIGQGATVSVMMTGEANTLHVQGDVTVYFELDIKVKKMNSNKNNFLISLG